MKKIYASIIGLSTILFSADLNAQVLDTTYAYTGGVQTFTVPAGVSSIQIECWGAQGGSSQPCSGALVVDGGLGGYSIGELAVTPGEILEVYVGEFPSTTLSAASAGGFNGGGGSGHYGGPGGGASDVRVAPYALGDRVIVAGGGGGGNEGCPDHGAGGNGGGLIADDGTIGSGFIAGLGGTQVAGGAAGSSPGVAGSLGQGGSSTGYHVSGGGGGYYGGGGAYAAGAGGGSSYIGGVTSASTTSGVQTGHGQVIITVLCNALSATVSSDTVCVGEEVILHAESTIGGTITWDGGITDSVAFTIDSAGVTTYTATSDTTGDCAYVVDIFVEPSPVVTLGSTDELTGADGTTNITLVDGIFPFTFDWDNDGTGDFDDDQNQTGLTAGWYTVTVMHGNGCTTTDSIQVNSQLSIKELGDNVVLYPNPATNHIIVEGMDSFDYSIVDAQGKVVLNGQGGENEKIGLEKLERGIYVIRINYNGISQSVRLVKE